ncbi:hypothetical protein A2U01_0043028, partial [Trifolium medium]|nr:hypothetical protein [Trifolium medium]
AGHVGLTEDQLVSKMARNPRKQRTRMKEISRDVEINRAATTDDKGR